MCTTMAGCRDTSTAGWGLHSCKVRWLGRQAQRGRGMRGKGGAGVRADSSPSVRGLVVDGRRVLHSKSRPLLHSDAACTTTSVQHLLCVGVCLLG